MNLPLLNKFTQLMKVQKNNPIARESSKLKPRDVIEESHIIMGGGIFEMVLNVTTKTIFLIDQTGQQDLTGLQELEAWYLAKGWFLHAIVVTPSPIINPPPDANPTDY